MKTKWLTDHPQDTVLLRVKTKKAVPAAKPEELITGSMSDVVGELFYKVDAIVFVSAVGIAVRLIAPYLKHKSVDPAVVVLDETAKFCISLLSGHTGGANELCARLSQMTGAIPVITTATDREEKPAIDVFAKQNDLVVTSWEKAKQISADVLSGVPICLAGRKLTVATKVPDEVLLNAPMDTANVVISPFTKDATEDALLLVPRWIYAGIGCRKNTPKEAIKKAVELALKEAGVFGQALRAVASIDLKKDEAGLCEFCKEQRLPFTTYSAEELLEVAGQFQTSEFVLKVTGVDNVCERSAVKRSKGGELIFPKHAYEGVTVALACREEALRFE